MKGTECLPPLTSRDLHTRRLLAQIEANQQVTQRALSKELGIALGLTNLLIRRFVKRGWIEIVGGRPNRPSYLITPAGIAEKTRATRRYLHDTIRLYTETRERIRERLEALSADWPSDTNGQPKRIVFYGAGEVAEIGFISLQRTDLQLVGVVDDHRRQPFFGHRVHSPSFLDRDTLNGRPFERLVVMSLRRSEKIRARLLSVDYPLERVFWL